MSKTNPWLIYAKDDFDALDALELAPIPRVTCFHAQQLVEKTLKSQLFYSGIPVARPIFHLHPFPQFSIVALP